MPTRPFPPAAADDGWSGGIGGGIGATRAEARTRLALSQAGTNPRGIGQRLRHLDREWPLERGLIAGLALASAIGLAAGLRGHRGWFALPAVAAGLLLAEALSGCSPARAALRAAGWRGAADIHDERMALKVLRGDFAGFEEGAPAGHILAAVRGRVGGQA